MGRNISLVIAAITITAWALPASAFTPAARSRGSTTLNVLNYGAVPNDSGDDTPAIQRAIDSLPSTGGTVYIPAGTYRINTLDSSDITRRGINLRSLMHLKMDSGTILKAITNSSMDRFYVLNIHQVNDVEVSGGQIVGERSTHIDTRTSSDQKSEWGHGIMVRGSSRVTIRNIVVKDHWGDGISVGAQNLDVSNDVIIDNAIVDNNRRNGITIGRSQYVKVYDSEIRNTQGTAPEYGIDIEPDTTTDDYAVSPRVDNCYIHHNKAGVQIYDKVSTPVIVNNRIEFNDFGIYAKDVVGGTITGNRLSHHVFQGLYFTGDSRSYTVSGNYFRNNGLKALNYVVDYDNPFTAFTGYVSETYSLTRAHFKLMGTYKSSSYFKIGTNYYAK